MTASRKAQSKAQSRNRVNIQIVSREIGEIRADLTVILVTSKEGEPQVTAGIRALDRRLGGRLDDVIGHSRPLVQVNSPRQL